MSSRRRRDEGFDENGFAQFIRSPFRFTRRQIGNLFGEDESMRIERSPVDWVVAIVTFPFQLLFAFAVFMVHAWATSRNGFAFVRAIPAIGVGLVVFAAVWAVNFRFEKNIGITAARYARELQEFPDEPERAELYAQKLVEFSPEEPDYKYRLGLSRAMLDRLPSARRLMRQVAGEDKAGYPAAHVWLGRDFAFSSDLDLTEAERDKLASIHFKFALEKEPNNPLALLGMAELHEKKGDLKTASEYLTQMVTSEWTSLLQIQVIPKLVEMQQKIGEEDLARRMLQQNMNRISALTRRMPDTFEIWVILARCATMLQDYDRAEQIINDGYQTAKSKQVRDNLVDLLASVFILEADDVESIEDKESYQKRLYSICEAIQWNPRYREAYTRLVEYAAPTTLKEVKANWLRESIIDCPNQAVIHVLLGLQKITDGDFVRGQEHWRIADQQYDSAQFVVNNMIEMALTERPSEFGNLLDMITVAMELFPDQAAFYQTRGMYYTRNKQYPEAIKDLTYAVEKMPNLISARTLLKEAYLANNDEENALNVQLDIDRLVMTLDDTQQKMVKDFLAKAEQERRQRKQEEENN